MWPFVGLLADNNYYYCKDFNFNPGSGMPVTALLYSTGTCNLTSECRMISRLFKNGVPVSEQVRIVTNSSGTVIAASTTYVDNLPAGPVTFTMCNGSYGVTYPQINYSITTTN